MRLMFAVVMSLTSNRPSAYAGITWRIASSSGRAWKSVMTIPEDVKWLTTEEGGPGEPVDSDTDTLAAAGRGPAGRIVHDERGNAIWKWAGDLSSTGTSSGILKHIDPRDLNVEGQTDKPTDSRGSRIRATDSGGGYDPYNQGDVRDRATHLGNRKQVRR